ncbi:PBSX family phage portal protein [Acinetobacter johnsonii ANC 3681]|uniref:PBSX family phage portal protein n=1 Tax=Acinetobacter johnsonii ANC 3681 TaxID=1217662 RepID=N9CTE2_ACIJO|nr:phage portal protein [Acinetobacter johnsonii]ENV71493.1 PBSX family phage portal protein [Acinetobacter johnsonii ANC 3681]
MNLKSLVPKALQRISSPAAASIEAPSKKSIVCSNFGQPEPVLDGHTLFEYGYCPKWQDWYELPYDMLATAKLFRATSHHTSALIVKRNILTSDFIPHPLLSRHDFNALALNLLTFANCYANIKRNRFGGIIGLGSRPALNMRRGLDLSSYYQLDYDQTHNHVFQPQDMIHLFESDIGQEVYGIPNYLSSINAILLNESATLFRRRYYKNGAHAGFILHITDAMHTQADVTELEDALENSKGAGNFKNLLLYTPGGKEKGVNVIPLAEVAAKDEFYNIKIASRDDQLAGHRIPPQLIGVVPQNAGGFGDVEKAAKVFYYNEIIYYQNLLKQINERLGYEVIKFKQYELLSTNVT